MNVSFFLHGLLLTHTSFLLSYTVFYSPMHVSCFLTRSFTHSCVFLFSYTVFYSLIHVSFFLIRYSEREKEHISALAVNLSQQMDFNNSLLEQVSRINIEYVDSKL